MVAPALTVALIRGLQRGVYVHTVRAEPAHRGGPGRSRWVRLWGPGCQPSCQARGTTEAVPSKGGLPQALSLLGACGGGWEVVPERGSPLHFLQKLLFLSGLLSAPPGS